MRRWIDRHFHVKRRLRIRHPQVQFSTNPSRSNSKSVRTALKILDLHRFGGNFHRLPRLSTLFKKKDPRTPPLPSTYKTLPPNRPFPSSFTSSPNPLSVQSFTIASYRVYIQSTTRGKLSCAACDINVNELISRLNNNIPPILFLIIRGLQKGRLHASVGLFWKGTSRGGLSVVPANKDLSGYVWRPERRRLLTCILQQL